MYVGTKACKRSHPSKWNACRLCCTWVNYSVNKVFIFGSPQGMSCLVVGVSSSDRCYCLWLRCYQVPGGVGAVPRSAALLLVKFRFWVQLWIFISRWGSLLSSSLYLYYSVKRYSCQASSAIDIDFSAIVMVLKLEGGATKYDLNVGNANAQVETSGSYGSEKNDESRTSPNFRRTWNLHFPT